MKNEQTIIKRNEIIGSIIEFELNNLFSNFGLTFRTTKDYSSSQRTIIEILGREDNFNTIKRLCQISLENSDIKRIPNININNISYHIIRIDKPNNIRYSTFVIETDYDATTVCSILPVTEVLKDIRNDYYLITLDTEGEEVSNIKDKLKFIQICVDGNIVPFNAL